MTPPTWDAVDRYIADLLIRPDPALDAALADSAAAGLPSINVSPVQGKLLQILARSIGAKKSWKSARSAGTARSGWREHCPRAVD